MGQIYGESQVTWVPQTLSHSLGCLNSVDPSSPSKLWPRVGISSVTSMLFQFMFEMWCGKNGKKQKRGQD